MTPRPYQTLPPPRRGGAAGDRASERQPEPELQEALEVRLAGRVPVDAAEVRRRGRPAVVALVVHRAVEDVERFDADLQAQAVRDRRRLGEVQVYLPERRTAELVVAEHRR